MSRSHDLARRIGASDRRLVQLAQDQAVEADRRAQLIVELAGVVGDDERAATMIGKTRAVVSQARARVRKAAARNTR